MTQGQDLPPGAKFADFTIEGVLGRGGMGVVYRARQERLSRLVALKVIAPHLTHDVGFRERFRREAAMAAAIDHPSILPIYEAGEFEEQPFIVMRHVAGTDLKTLIERKGRLDPKRAVEITSDIAGALDAAHRRGLVHRDVKPANILIGDEADDEVVYLTDFGLTKGRGDERLTQTGKWVGTVDYMAPEQIEGKEIDGRSDEYALACVLYEALTGTVPFQRESDVQIMWAHIRDDPPRPSEVRSELGTAMDAVIARGMAKDPEDRFATCREFSRAAADALGGTAPAPASPAAGGTVAGTVVGGTVVGGTLTGDVPPPPPSGAGAAPVASGGGLAPPPRPPARKPGGNRTPILIGAGAIAVIAIGVVAALALGGGDDKGGGSTVFVTEVTNVTAPVSAAETAAESTPDTTSPTGTTEGGDTGPVGETTGTPDTGTGEPGTTDVFDTGEAPGTFPPASAQAVVDLAKRPVPFVALYDLIQGGNAGTLRLAYDGDTRIAYRVELADQGTIWAGFADGAIQFGCLQTPDVDEPACTDGTDREQEYRNLIQQFVSGLLSAEAVETNFGAIAADDPPVLPGEMTGQPVACIQSVGAATQRLCVREDSIITEVSVVEEGKEIGARARDASTEPSEDDFAPPAAIS